MAEEGAKTGFYGALEGKYYDFLDWLESIGLPVYKLVDPLEERNIPTFPLAVLLALVLVGGLVFFIAPVFLQAESELSVLVQDENGDAVFGAQVKISLSDGEEIASLSTDSAGRAQASVPRGKEFLITASKEPDFLANSATKFVENKSETFSISLERKVVQLRKEIRLLRPGTNELIGKLVEVEARCSNDASFLETKSTSSGFISLDVPSNCGQLQIIPQEGFSAQNASFDAAVQGSIELFLSEAEVGRGDLTVEVKDSLGKSLAGIRVNLIAQNASTGIGTIFSARDTGFAGFTVFNDVPEGKYFVTVSDPTGIFSEFDSSKTGDIKSVASGSQQKFAVVLEKKIIGKIKLDVTYKANFSAIEGAVVSLSKDSTLISTKQTGPDGLAEFGVGEQVQYKIVVDKDGYLIETLEVLPREEPYSVALELATVKNSQSLAVTIVDETGNPVEDVRLSLRSAIDESAVAETITGLNGTGFFERVKDGQYYVSALKPGFGETVSQAIELNARQQNAIQLSLEIGFGNVEVAILGEKNEPVAGANVSLINFITGEILERGVTNAQGVTTLRTRADKIAFAVASAFDYLPYTSVPVQVGKDNTNSLQLNLKKEIAALSLEFVGLVFEGKTVKDSATPLLNAGQSYGAKFLLLVPAGSAFDEAGVHIRTGVAQEGVSNILEKDGIFLRDALAAFNEILRGTSYTPQNGFGTDAVHYTSSDAKWVEMRFNEPVPGVYEIVVDLAVRENAKQGEALDLWYRAFGKSGGYVRFPADEVLGSKESTAEKQALYAQAKNKKFSVGPSSLCIENFCTLMSVENISEQVQTSVVDEFLADTSSKYRLKFSISSISDEVFPAVELKVEESAGAIEIKNFEVVNTGGAKVSGTAVGSTFSANIGDVRQDDIFSGVFEFEPKVEGIANLAIELFSGNLPAKEKIFENNLLLNISPASELVVEIVPKIIVPFVNNNLLLRVTEKEGEAPVSNALVTLKKGSTILAQGHTNREGIFPATIPAQNAGTVISVFVEKHGFKTAQLDIAVTENIVQTIPAEIKEHLVVGEKPQKELTISLLNLTQIPLTINSIEPSSAFDELVEFDFDQKIVGQILDVNGSADTTFTFSLTKAGEELKQPATVSGAVNVEVTNKELSKSWHSKIPTEIRIGFGDEVDQADCLSFSQTAWSIFSSLRGTKTLSLSIQNNCRVNGAAIPVGPLQAKLNLGAQNPVGEFKARVQIEGEIKQFSEDETANLAEKEINLQASNSIVLGTSFKEISATIPANNEATLSLEFSPQNVASAQQEFSIDFRAAHPTKKAIEFIRNKISVMLAINDLAECINILPQENLRLTTCPFNTGYDFFPNNFSGVQAYGGYPQAYGSGFGGTFGGGTGFGYENFNPGYRSYPPFGQNYGLGSEGARYNFPQGAGAGYLSDPNLRGFDPYQTQPSFARGLPSYITQDPRYSTGMAQDFPQNYGSSPSRTFPYSNFSAPFYGGDVFSPTAGGMFGCGSAPVRVANNCSSAVELNFETTQALHVDKPNFVVEKGKQQPVLVHPAYFTGLYPINVTAKLAESQEQPQEIAQIKVAVENRLTQSYRDCISINPTRKLKFDSFYGKPVILEVKNSCYDVGVRLIRSNDTVFFPAEVLRAPTDVPGSGVHEMIENWALLDEIFEIGTDGRTVQVQRFEIFKALKNYCNSAPRFPNPSLENPFAVIGNLRYFFSQGYYSVNGRTNMIVSFVTEFGQRKSIEFSMILEDWWEALPFAERLVSYGDPAVQPAQCIQQGKLDLKAKYKGCIPESELELLEQNGYTTNSGGASGLMLIAIPKSQANSCQEYFARTGYLSTLPSPANPTTIEQRKYNPSYIDGQNVPVRTGSAQSYPSALEKGGCGTVDTISDLAPATIEKDGLKIFLSVVNGKEIQASIDAAEWRKKGKPAVDIRENVLVTVNRVVPAVSDRVTIPFSICLKQGETAVEPPDREPPIIDPNLGAVCPNGGKTGNEVFEGFGFDKILLDWRVEKVEENACLGAKGANYCDAVQFSIALNKKAGKIKELLEGLDESKCAVEGKEKCAEAQKNSTELFRFLGKTMQVANNAKQIGAANEKYLFFQNTDGTLLKNTEVEQEISKELDELKRTISSSSDNSRVISSTKSLLESLSKNQKTLNGTLIFGLIANDPKALGKKKADGKLEFEEQLKEIGILSDTIEGKTNYIITFEEFKKFFENLDKASGEGAKACETPTENKNCTMDEKNVRIEEIAVLEGNKNGTEITVQFLNDFLKSIKDFGVGVRSREQMNEQEKETVMKSIKNFGAKGYEDFFSFYSENIGFNANLIKDGFSDDFRSDFEKEYSSKELIAGDFFDEEQSNPQWEFEIKGTQEKELSDSGEFKTTIAYDWSKGKNNAPQITIELELSKPLAEISEHYAKNPLFYFPVDGTVGLENEAVQREGYGIRIPPGNFPQEFLRFNHYSEQEAQLEPFLYFTQKSTSEWKQRFDPNYSGEILKISREQVQFTPTDPIGVELTIRKTTPQSEPAGMLYSLQDGTNHVSAQSLLKWKFEKDEIGKRSEGAYSDSRFERSILCGTGNGDPRNGFVIANGGSGETVMKTVIYVPTRFGGKVSDSALNIDCIKDQATLARYIDRASGNTDAKLLRIGENILNNSNTQRLLEAYTLKNLLEMVKDNSRLVCAKVENKQLSLVWNEEQALKFGTG